MSEYSANDPAQHFTTGFVLGHSIAFLDLSDQLIAFSCDHIKIVIGKATPFLLD